MTTLPTNLPADKVPSLAEAAPKPVAARRRRPRTTPVNVAALRPILDAAVDGNDPAADYGCSRQLARAFVLTGLVDSMTTEPRTRTHRRAVASALKAGVALGDGEVCQLGIVFARNAAMAWNVLARLGALLTIEGERRGHATNLELPRAEALLAARRVRTIVDCLNVVGTYHAALVRSVREGEVSQ